MSSDELQRRLASLPPDKRRLLELRLKREGLSPEGGRRKPEGSPEADPGGALQLPSELAQPDPSAPPAPMEMSLFFFSADGSGGARPGRYQLLLDSARFADRHGFTAVWTPERHFQDFGGLYPNPSLLASALASITERIEIRAGSVVLPLHDPVRLAEEWAVVDNLSGGRAAIACAAGWHPDDFILRPQDYEDRKEVLVRHLEDLRTLWRGDAIERRNGAGETIEVRTLPRPVREELPVWTTSSGNTRTWEQAGELDTHLLSSLGSQPFPDLEEKIRRYRAAREDALGEDGGGGAGGEGKVTLMLHTYLDESLAAAQEATREPLGDYLRSHLQQRDSFLTVEGIDETDLEALIPLAFEHYTRAASLIGTAESVTPLINYLARLGVNEIACLVDFGLEPERVMASLERLAAVVRRHHPTAAEASGARVSDARASGARTPQEGIR
ncbi:MAG: MupA/Atu3671 family FMN-dependent luciferase-like monooxygenase [Acidobacteriota bacterium]|nr:MupA/Atu3671 family FMN-dependent luciferase-like monooxygenase [Acidobacteriota bacterium]